MTVSTHKRRWALLLAGLLIVGTLAGCGIQRVDAMTPGQGS
ncbi:MAG: hypothetical protein U0841_02965 [Chloroflexia bacterium]